MLKKYGLFGMLLKEREKFELCRTTLFDGPETTCYSHRNITLGGLQAPPYRLIPLKMNSAGPEYFI